MAPDNTSDKREQPDGHSHRDDEGNTAPGNSGLFLGGRSILRHNMRQEMGPRADGFVFGWKKNTGCPHSCWLASVFLMIVQLRALR